MAAHAMIMRMVLGNGLWRRETGAFVLAVIGIAAMVGVFTLASGGSSSNGGGPRVVPQALGTFESYAQLQQYIAANARSAQQYNRYGRFFGGLPAVNGGAIRFGTVTATGSLTSTVSAPSYTGTNVQVQGVDEPDRVKTDGTHLFVSTQDSVAIINAYPPNSTAVLSTLSFPNMVVIGLEIAQNRLMVIGQDNSAAPKVELLLYDTSTLASPEIIQNVSIAGFYVAARLTDGYVYAVIQQPSYVFNDQGNATAVMPTESEGGVEMQLPPSSVYYTPIATQISYYTMIPGVSMATGKENITSILTGPSTTVYISTSNIYLVYTNYLDLYYADGIPGDFFSGGAITSQIVQRAQNSTLLRVSYANGTVTVAKAGIVPGTLLNQFSMDEYNGYLRVATSRFAMINGAAATSDDVYVLDKNMNQTSALRNISPGENIYAVRFVGQLGYVVTFEQVDPLFVISFKDVSNPVILSALKVSGYSDYLHPLPGGYLVGVGKDVVPASNGDFSYYLGLKLSLFRIFDNSTSQQVANMLIGDRGTDSPVLSDHLAFTFDSSRNITIIPLTLYVVSGNQTNGSGFPPYGDPVWQGVYVIKVTPAGFTLLERVSQYPADQNFGDSPNSGLQIDRGVIIGDYLYTVSQSEVMVSGLASFSTAAVVQLPS